MWARPRATGHLHSPGRAALLPLAPQRPEASPHRSRRGEEERGFSSRLFFYWQGSLECSSGRAGDRASMRLRIPPPARRQRPGSCLGCAVTDTGTRSASGNVLNEHHERDTNVCFQNGS